MGNLKKHIKIAKLNSKITPKLHAWLNNHDGVHITKTEVLEKTIDILTPSAGDRSGAFHPSQLYQCKRKQIFDYFGLEGMRSYNPTLQNIFNDGHFRHLRWQIMLLEAGIITDVEVPVSIPKYRLSGSMDGINEDQGWMFELKGTSQFREVSRRGAMPAHINQVNAYLLASGLESALVVYECKSSQNWVEIEVTRNEETIGEIESILGELNSCLDSNSLPEVLDDCKNKKGATYNNCPYSESCFGFNTTSDVKTFQIESRASVNRGNA